MASDFQHSPFPPKKKGGGRKKRSSFPSWSIALSVLLAMSICGFGAHIALPEGLQGESILTRILAKNVRGEDEGYAQNALSEAEPQPSGQDLAADAQAFQVASIPEATSTRPADLPTNSWLPQPAAPLKNSQAPERIEEESFSSDPMDISPEDALRDEPEKDPALLSMDSAPERDLVDETVFSPFAPEASAMSDPEALMNMPVDGAGHELPEELEAGASKGPDEPLCFSPTLVDALGVSGPISVALPVARETMGIATMLYNLYWSNEEEEGLEALQAQIDEFGEEFADEETAPGKGKKGKEKAAVATKRNVPKGLDPVWKPLIMALEKDGFDAKKLSSIFEKLGAKSYTPAFMAAKMAELYGVPGIGISRDTVPEPKLPRSYKVPVSEVTVGGCLQFIKKNKKTLTAIEKRHGVTASPILGVLLVETRMGTSLGRDNALRVLASMAVTSTPEMLSSMGNQEQCNKITAGSLPGSLKDKSRWAYNELKALLRYAEQQSYPAHLIPGSVFGAIGICQFMPSNVPAYGQDGDRDGQVNLFNVTDAMYSVAKYLEAHGWRAAQAQPQKHAVVRTYNHSYSYASTVLATANYIDRAIEGKVPILTASPVIGVARKPKGRVLVRFGQYVDPSLRRTLRPIPKSARIRLDSYKSLLN